MALGYRDPVERIESLTKGTLKQIGGSQSDNWNSVLANQTVKTLWLKQSEKETSDHQVGATVARLIGIGPKDELDGMMAAQDTLSSMGATPPRPSPGARNSLLSSP